MGQFKDAVFVEIWRHLKTMRNYSTHLSTLNSPNSHAHGVRSSWNDLMNNLREERLKKGVGMKVIIGERPDIFVLSSSETGHPVVTLTPAAQVADPDGGVAKQLPTLAVSLDPPSGTATDEQVMAAAAQAEAQLLEGLAQQQQQLALVQTPVAPGRMTKTGNSSLRPALAPGAVSAGDLAEQQAATAAAQAAALAEAQRATPAAKEKKQKATGSHQRSFATTPGPVWAGHGRGYLDLIWTPKVEAAKEREKRKEWAMVRALYEAVDSYDGEIVTISQMGTDFKVAQLKKDPQFQFEKLVDILKRYEDVFEVIVDSTRGFVARLQPGAMVALPDAEEALQAAINEAELMLPERIRNAGNIKERMQALRIEVVYALHRRGGSATLPELGQEHRVQKGKANVAQAKKLIDFVKIFPMNFSIHNDTVTLTNFDCDDTSMIDFSIQKNNASFASSQYGASSRGRYTPSTGSRPAPYAVGAQRTMPSHHSSSIGGLGAPMTPGQFSLPAGLPPASLAALLHQPQSLTGFSDPIRR